MGVWSYELERNGEEVVMAYVKVLSQHLHGGTEDKMKNLSQNIWCPAKIQTVCLLNLRKKCCYFSQLTSDDNFLKGVL
jgi:hypothetical protein